MCSFKPLPLCYSCYRPVFVICDRDLKLYCHKHIWCPKGHFLPIDIWFIKFFLKKYNWNLFVKILFYSYLRISSWYSRFQRRFCREFEIPTPESSLYYKPRMISCLKIKDGIAYFSKVARWEALDQILCYLKQISGQDLLYSNGHLNVEYFFKCWLGRF